MRKYIERAVVIEDCIFDSVKEYCDFIKWKMKNHKRYQILKEEVREDGTVFSRIRIPYNDYEFIYLKKAGSSDIYRKETDRINGLS